MRNFYIIKDKPLCDALKRDLPKFVVKMQERIVRGFERDKGVER